MTSTELRIAAFLFALAGCSGVGGVPAGSQAPASLPAPTAGLGPVVQSKFGGTIFGWDINQNGGDGVLTETLIEPSGSALNAIETFDEASGKITKLVAKNIRPNADVEPVVDAIAGDDVGIIDVEHDFPSKGFLRRDHFDLMNPVSGGKITARSMPLRFNNVVPIFVTNNQASPNQLGVVYYRSKQGRDRVGMYTYDAAANRWGNRYDFPARALFNNLPIYAAVDGLTSEGVIGYLQRSRYNPHESSTFDVVDAATGKHLRSFYGVGFGLPNGMAIDSTTGIMCTTTTGDRDVEFYKLATGKGKAVQIPVLYTNGPETNGAAVAVDPINHLFLIAQLVSTFSPSGGSTVIVYNENGKLVEYINGFSFFDRFSVVVPHLAVNPSSRIGYVNGPGSNELQEFSY